MSDRFTTWVMGYAQEWSVRQGESVSLAVSGAGADSVEVQLVKLIHGDTQPAGPGFQEREVASDADGTYPLVTQPSQHGSYGRLGAAAPILGDGAVSLCAMVCPTRPLGDQPVLSAWDAATGTGIALMLEDGLVPALWLDSVRLAAPARLRPGVWYSLCGSWDPAIGALAVHARPVVNSYNSRLGPTARLLGADATATGPTSAARWPATDLLVGALDAADGRMVCGAYNGKLALPCVYDRALGVEEVDRFAASGHRPSLSDGLAVWWDLTAGIDTLTLTAIGRAQDGRLLNAPTRGVTAHNWDGSRYSCADAPQQYGAVHFHDDDVDDVGWAPTCDLTLTDAIPSGVYALRLRAGDHEDHVPFFVRARRGQEAPMALIIPTASYQAYANEHDATRNMVQGPVGHTPSIQPMDLLLMEHPELGLSMYDLHSDGSGVSLSSRRRPILGMRPRHRFSLMGTWQFPSDLYLVDWLEHHGYRYDVLTDEDLHRDGPAALEPYRVVMTGTHPEYTSEPMLNAYESYLAGSGNIMYMGGNGFYWVVTFHPEHPWLMEVRRGENGVRAWGAAPGETYHSTTGEKGGLWRDRGRPPQQLFGTGFTSEGYGGSFHYHRMPDGDLPEMRWVLDGVEAPERIGDFGLVGGGAAGQEIDRADVLLGTPPETYLLACAQDQNDSYKVVPEDHGAIVDGVGGTEHPGVRADLTYCEAPGGGAVFATSSIAWAGALSHAGYANDVSRITANVLDRFIAPVG
jgi:N,N-dimethylformamidase